MDSRWKNSFGCAAALLLAYSVSGQRLTDWSLSSASNFSFHLLCESNLTYIVQSSSNLVHWTTIARGSRGGTNRIFTFPADGFSEAKQFFRSVQTNEPLLSFAVATRHGADLLGNSLAVDSFDSGNPAYSTNGLWDFAKLRDRGDVSVNDGITNTVPAEVSILGHVHTGSGEAVIVGPHGLIGSTDFQSAGSTGVEPGWLADDADGFFQEVIIPNVVWSALPGGGVVKGVHFDYIFNSAGYYQAGAVTVSGKILVLARDVYLKVGGASGLNLVGNDRFEIASNASITIYLDCADAIFGGQGIVNWGVANQCSILGTSHFRSLNVGGNGESICVIYAPYADVTLNGISSHFSGAIVANSLKLTGAYYIHFDEDLVHFDLLQ